MKSAKTSTGSREKSGSNSNVLTSVDFVLRTELNKSTETDFVHSITGRIIAESKARGEEDAGSIRASLIQFSEALDHGISAERLGDGISGDIAEYWEYLFDPETGRPKEEIQNEFEMVDLDLLIIDYIVIHPEFRGLVEVRRERPSRLRAAHRPHTSWSMLPMSTGRWWSTCA
jgi:hypothetical protein